MDNKDIKNTAPLVETQTQDVIENAEWGENHQDHILDHSYRSKTTPHACKGPNCINALEKL